MRLECPDSSHLFDDRLQLRQISQASAVAPHLATHPTPAFTPPKQRAWCSISILLYATTREGCFGMFHVRSVVHNLHLISLVLVGRSYARHSRK